MVKFACVYGQTSLKHSRFNLLLIALIGLFIFFLNHFSSSGINRENIAICECKHTRPSSTPILYTEPQK